MAKNSPAPADTPPADPAPADSAPADTPPADTGQVPTPPVPPAAPALPTEPATPDNTPLPGGGSWRWDAASLAWQPNAEYHNPFFQE